LPCAEGAAAAERLVRRCPAIIESGWRMSGAISWRRSAGNTGF